MEIFFTFTEATGGKAKAAAAKAPTGAAPARAGTAEAAATATEAAGAAAATGARQLQLGQWLIEASVISTAKEREEDEECNLKSDYELPLCYIIIQNSALTVSVPPPGVCLTVHSISDTCSSEVLFIKEIS